MRFYYWLCAIACSCGVVAISAEHSAAQPVSRQSQARRFSRQPNNRQQLIHQTVHLMPLSNNRILIMPRSANRAANPATVGPASAPTFITTQFSRPITPVIPAPGITSVPQQSLQLYRPYRGF